MPVKKTKISNTSRSSNKISSGAQTLKKTITTAEIKRPEWDSRTIPASKAPMTLGLSSRSKLHPTSLNVTSAHVDTMTLQILQKKFSPAKSKTTNVEDEKDYMKMLKDTVTDFKKKSLSRQRRSYANIAANNSAILNQTEISLVNQSAYDAILQDPLALKGAARQARIE